MICALQLIDYLVGWWVEGGCFKILGKNDELMKNQCFDENAYSLHFSIFLLRRGAKRGR